MLSVTKLSVCLYSLDLHQILIWSARKLVNRLGSYMQTGKKELGS